MTLSHLEWLIEEAVPDPEVILYEILPYSPARADPKSRQGEVPKGPGFELVKLCLKPLEPDITDHAIDWAIRCVQARARPGNAPTVGASF
jgi:hypothetical protein